MSRIVIVGGHGKIARLLVTPLIEAGHQVVSLVRNPAHAGDLEPLGAEVALLDLEADGTERFAELFTGAAAIVFSAGGGPDGNIERKQTVDLGGSLKSIGAATITGVRRFVQVSAISVDAPLPDDTEPVWRAYVEAKRDADTALRASGLDWTIIRPGRLTDDPATGLIALGPDVQRGDVTRADVARTLAAVLDDPRTIGHQWNLVGGDQPIARAIDALT